MLQHREGGWRGWSQKRAGRADHVAWGKRYNIEKVDGGAGHRKEQVGLIMLHGVSVTT